MLPVLKCSVKFSIDGEAGDNAGLLFSGIDKDEIRRGMVIAKPGISYILTHTSKLRFIS